MTSPSRLTPPGGILAACVLTATFTSVAAAEEKLEEITVTAEKREESLQKVPISIAALSSEAMEKLAKATVDNLLVPWTPFKIWPEFADKPEISPIKPLYASNVALENFATTNIVRYEIEGAIER